MAAASSFTWTGKKLTIAELITCFCTTPLPLVVKVTQVPSDYEKSCPKLSIGTVLFISGSGVEQRVALKTSDRNPKFISIPLEAKLKFEVVYTHDRGPPTFLENLLRGKVQSDLKVEISGNNGNRLSSTPDQEHGFPYGTFQVVGTYKETVLHAQTILSASGELNPLRRNISVNCPVSLDIATGIYGKSADEFQKLKNRLKQSQSTKTTNQADPSHDIALLSGVPKSLQDVHLLRHTCQLSNIVSFQTSVADAAGIPPQSSSSTAFKAAVDKLTDKVGSEIISKPKPRDSMFLERSSGMKLAAPVETRMTCYYEEAGSQKGQLTYENEVVKSKPGKDVYENDSMSRGKTEKRKEDTRKEATRSMQIGGLKDGVYIKDWKQKEAEKLSKEKVSQLHTVPSPPKVPSPPPVPSPSPSRSTVPLLPALRSPPAAPSVDDDYQGLYELPDETHKRVAIPLPRIPSETSNKVVKTGAGKQTMIKSVFGGFKDKLTKSMTKMPSFGASKSPTSPKGKSPKGDDGGETYDSLDDYEKTDENPVRTKVKKEEESEDSDLDLNYEIPEDAPKWKTLSQVPKDIKNFTILDVSLCLRLLNFSKYVKPFRERSVDGALLRTLDKKTLMQMFKMEEFEAKQLVTFAKDNWRPKI